MVAAGGVGAAVSIFALFTIGLQERYSIASFVGSDNRAFDTLEEFTATFGGSELTLIAVRGTAALDEETLACLEQIVPRAEALPAVQNVGAVTQLPELGRSLLMRHSLVKGVLISHDESPSRVCFIDWEDAGVGCAVVDVARLTYWLEPQERAEFCAAYYEQLGRTGAAVSEAGALDTLYAAGQMHWHVYRIARSDALRLSSNRVAALVSRAQRSYAEHFV